jgi:hypothetical protein
MLLTPGNTISNLSDTVTDHPFIQKYNPNKDLSSLRLKLRLNVIHSCQYLSINICTWVIRIIVLHNKCTGLHNKLGSSK